MTPYGHWGINGYSPQLGNKMSSESESPAGDLLLPLAGELVDYLQTLDWRQYVLAGDRKNLAVLAIVGALGFTAIVLRHMTTGPVGTKD